MKIFSDVFELLVNVFEAFVLVHFIFSFHKYDYKSIRSKSIYAACSVGYAALVSVMNSFISFEGILGFIYVLYILIISIIFLKGSIWSKLFTACLSNLIILFITIVVSDLISNVYKDDLYILYTQKGIGRFLTIILVQILIFCAFDIILKVMTSDNVRLKFKEWILILSVFGISITALVLIRSTLLESKINLVQSIYLLISEICLILINFVCFYMTYSLCKSHHETEELRINQQRYDLSIQYAESVKNQYNEMKILRHDMKQEYVVISGLLEAGKTESAADYIRSRMNSLSKAEIYMDVGNDRINSILNSKLSYAKSNEIEVICSSSGNIGGIDDADLCILLGNLMDNAIEGSLTSNDEAKFIEAKIVGDEVKNRIQITNSASAESEKSILNGETSKTDKSAHGFGIKSIQYIVHKYNGSLNYVFEHNSVICQVVLYK